MLRKIAPEWIGIQKFLALLKLQKILSNFCFSKQTFCTKLTLGAPVIYRYMVCGRRGPSVEFKVRTDVTVIMCMHMIIVPFTTTRNSGTQVLYSKLY